MTTVADRVRSIESVQVGRICLGTVAVGLG